MITISAIQVRIKLRAVMKASEYKCITIDNWIKSHLSILLPKRMKTVYKFKTFFLIKL